MNITKTVIDLSSHNVKVTFYDNDTKLFFVTFPKENWEKNIGTGGIYDAIMESDCKLEYIKG